MRISLASALTVGAAIGGVALVLPLAAPTEAVAQVISPGCQAINGKSEPISGPFTGVLGFSGDFFAGEVITATFTGTVISDGVAGIQFNGATVVEEEFSIGDDQGGAVSFTIPKSGKATINAGIGDEGQVSGGSVTLSCVAAPGGAAEAISSQAARSSLAQQSGLVFNRTSNLILNKPGNRGGGTQTSFVPQAGMTGGAGQGADAFGVWGDFTWSGLENDDAVSGSDGNTFTLSGGYDTPLADGLIAGAAVSVGGGVFDRKANDDTTTEINVGLTPYIAYQIDDMFSVQAAVGYTHARGSAENNGVDGDYVTNRYFIAGEGSTFQTWGDFSIFSSVGVLWGQSFQQSYTDDAGQRFDSIQSDLGSVTVTAQPAYLFTIDANAGDFIEPYILGQYSYDFSQTEVAGAANDADEFLVGAGVNAFTGDGLSGGVEFNRTLGRQDNTATSVRATVRFDF